MSDIRPSAASRRVFRAAVLVALSAAPLGACARYCASPQRPTGEAVAGMHPTTVRVTTTDGTTRELTRVRIARDTLYGVLPGLNTPEFAFALADIQRFDVKRADAPSYLGRLAALHVLNALLLFVVLRAARHA